MLGAAEIQRLLRENGLRPSKALGQHFVADPNTVRRIVRLAGVQRGDHVVEIGAGLGSLTVALGRAEAHVVAVEIDRRLVPILHSVVAELPRVSVMEADALCIDWTAVLDPSVEWKLVANLPYNVATPLVIGVLESAAPVRSLLVMVQREVGERLASSAGERAYGAVSVKVAYWAAASVVGAVSPAVFIPRPAVESVLVRIDRRPTPAVPERIATYERICAVVGAGFGQRRKMLRRSLASMVAPEAFAATGIEPSARAEELDIEQWGRLAGWVRTR